MNKTHKYVEKIAKIMSWNNLSNDEKIKKIECIILDVYNLGCADGYAERFYEENK